jgi:hypothetical protein
MRSTDLLEEGPAGVPRDSALSSTVASLLFEAEATADPLALSSAQGEAKVALKRLRTVNSSFLSNLEYVRGKRVRSSPDAAMRV